MTHTVFILGTDRQQCKELREILQDRIADTIVTSSDENLPAIQHSDSVIITAEEKATGILYRRLLDRLEDQIRRAKFLGELIHLFSSPLQNDEILDKIAYKSADVLGDTAFIVMENDVNQFRLDAAHSTDSNRLIKILAALLNLGNHSLASKALAGILDERKPVLIGNLQEVQLPEDLRMLAGKYSIGSVIVAPIQTKDYVLGAFVTTCTRPKAFTEDDLNLAIELSNFVAVAVENASLVRELQRSAITDSLTGLYNARFFNDVLGREAARADRHVMALSLLMIDVDSFKLVNDTYGHVVGNKVLSQISRILERSVRNTDFVFRCGGDEFGVVLPGTPIDGAMRLADKILEKVEGANILTNLGYSGPVTVSIGASEHHHGSHFESIVAEADQALYKCKRAAKNCSKAFDRELNRGQE